MTWLLPNPRGFPRAGQPSGKPLVKMVASPDAATLSTRSGGPMMAGTQTVLGAFGARAAPGGWPLLR
jgi:hypothetical protein